MDATSVIKTMKDGIEKPGLALRSSDRETRSLAGQLLGSRTSEKKRESSRRNGTLGADLGRERGGQKPKPLTDIPCRCGAGLRPSHLSKCPRGRAIRRREVNGWPVVW